MIIHILLACGITNRRVGMSKLLKIQSKLVCQKNHRNTFGNYNYRSCEDILEALKPLLLEENLSLTISDEIVAVLDRVYVKATATLFDGEKDIAKVHGFAREALTKKGMDESQITGASSSYARKYALNGMFCIDDTKDADTQDNSVEEPKKSFDGNNVKDVYEQVIKPHVAEEMEEANTASFNKLSCAIYNSESIEELEKLREKSTNNEYRKDWARLLKYKPKDHQELLDVFEEQKETLMKL